MVDARLLIFGYGSLIWRPSFDYEKRWPACAVGWARRFWQGSPDHRGTPEAPGRVVTLVPEQGARCWGVVYEIAAERSATVLDELDRREQGGYTRREIEVLAGAEATPHTASVYIALAGNPHWLGAAAPLEIARHIGRAHGPSGPNREYLLRLARALQDLGPGDEHVCELVALVTPESLASEGP
jgi:cation transport regulator ChaC